jgi:class 3 adenylate cyclase/tetratricopeptide (TPR) repeat protein
MQACSGCGHENTDTAKFCMECATPLRAAGDPPERRKLATLLFCDMSGSTALAERVDSEAMQELLHAYYREMRSAVERHGGSVEKFIGDAVVAGFGVAEAHEDDALRACRAALEMQERLAALNDGLERRFGTRVSIRIGLNTGEVVIGGPMAAEMFATGDAVNVAARLEQAAAPGEVLLGEWTHRLVRGLVSVELLEPLAAKGKSKRLIAYRLLGMRGTGSRAERETTPLAGRARELAMLEKEFVAVATEGVCRLVTVVGEAGVGKSRLIAELGLRVEPRARAVRGICLSYGEGITYWAIAQVVRELAGIGEADTAAEARSRIEAACAGIADGEVVAARIAQLLGLGEQSSTAEQTTEAIQRFLAAQGAGRPLVVIIDDIHWAEPTLLDLLEGLPRAVESPLLVLAAARPELLERRPDWAVGVGLEPLDAGEASSLLVSLLGEAPAPVLDKLARASAGNPLFAEELVGMLIDDGVLRRQGESSVVERDLESISLPPSLSALLGARLDRLERGARDALERGAVEGELFHRGSIVELSDPAARTGVPASLETLTGKDLVRPAAGTIAREAAYRFKHMLIRDAAYRATAKKLRALLHEQFATWLERLAGERVAEYEEILAYHLEQSFRYHTELGPPEDLVHALGERAAGYLSSAARRAVARGDLAAAANLLARALELGIAAPHKRVRAQVELGNALGETGRIAEADTVLAEASEAAVALGERGVAALADVYRLTNRVADPELDFGELQAVSERAIGIFGELGDDRGLALAGRLLGFSLGRQGRWGAGVVELERALRHADAAGDPAARRRVVGTIVTGLGYGPTRVSEAVARCEELLESSGEDRVLEAIVKRFLGQLYAMAGRFEEALELVAESSAVLDALNQLTLSWLHRRAAAYARELAGDAPGAEQEVTSRWSSLRDSGYDGIDRRAIDSALDLANLYCDAGRWDDAERTLTYGRHVALQEHRVEGFTRLALEARIAAHRGRLAEALPLAERAVEFAERFDWLNFKARAWAALAEVRRARGELAEADSALATALGLCEEKENVAAAARLRAAAQDLAGSS